VKAMSIRQPWAALIIAGDKDIECRLWATSYRGPILIHASLGDAGWSDSDIERQFRCKIPSLATKRGGIIGVVDLVDVVTSHRSKWFAKGCYGFILANPRPLRFLAMPGRLNMFDVPAEIARQIALAA
jgi:ASCH domain